MADVRKAVAFCRKLGLRVLGLVETMGAVQCPHCGERIPLFRRRDAARPADVPLLAEVPFDPALHAACDEGRAEAFLADENPTANTLKELARRVAEDTGKTPETADQNTNQEGGQTPMRYAIPTITLALHGTP